MDDISLDINDLFGVDAPLGKPMAVSAPLNDLFGVDEDSSQPVSSSPALVMPQFYCAEVPSPEGSIALRDPQHRPSPNPWDPRLVVDLALGMEDLDTILASYGLSAEDYASLTQVPAFRRDLSTTIKELRENGITYAKKAAAQAESYLVDVDDIVQDKSIAAATRLAAIQWITKMGRLEPKETKTEQSSGVTVNLQINYSN